MKQVTVTDFRNPEGVSALDSLCRPSLIELQSNLFALQFDLMKIVPARFILETAMKTGQLEKGGLVVESSSGTFALGLAIVCANHGLRLSLVTGPLEKSVEWRLRHLGATIDRIESGEGLVGGIQQARLNHLAGIIEKNPRAFWPRQYDNPLHPMAYEEISRATARTLGRVDFVVGSVGSGSSLCGFARILRESNPDMKVIAVDHNLSVLFGPTTANVNPLCHECYDYLLGMGSDIVIPNVDHVECDEVHWVPVAKMIRMVHYLHSHFGLLLGPTAGASYAVADWVARRNPGSRVLTIFPDHGIRYMQSVYNGDWLAARAEELKRDWDEPTVVNSPMEVTGDWSRFAWNRRSYPEVMGHGPLSRQAKA